MKYNNDWLQEQHKNDKTIAYQFFWGHQSNTSKPIGKTCLSQWFESAFEYQGIQYLTAEHWMMAKKAQLFRDQEAFEKIVHCKSPKAAKAIGRQVKGFEHAIWISKRESIVKNGNYLKFKQHPSLWEYLNGTEDKILVEASPYDKIWGIGMKVGDPGIENPRNWKGLNLLGYALMEVRQYLRTEASL